jgi:hypothetical protein
MATEVKRRRGTTAEHTSFTGALGEVTVDTTKDTLVVHDGSTAGGYPLLREDLVNLTNPIVNKTIEAGTFTNGYTEEVFAVTGTTPALSPTNGSIQTWTLSGASTPTAGTWASGQSLTLMIDDGTAFTVTWTSLAVTWKTDSGTAPTLNTTGFTVISLWKVNTTIYGARVGNA